MRSDRRNNLAVQAAAILLQRHRGSPSLTHRLYLLCQTDDAQQTKFQSFQEDQSAYQYYEATTKGSISHSDASYNMKEEPLLARCGSETLCVTSKAQAAQHGNAQVGRYLMCILLVVLPPRECPADFSLCRRHTTCGWRSSGRSCFS